MGNVTPTARIVIIVLAALALIGLIAYARGYIHHHGWWQIGVHAASAVTVAVPGRG